MTAPSSGCALVHGDDPTAPALKPWVGDLTDVRPLHPGDELSAVLAEIDAAGADVIVEAGPLERRLMFALTVWPRLAVGGRLVLIAAGSARAIGITFALAVQVFRELERIDIAPGGADVAILHKCRQKPYVNWNRDEGRASWQVGDDDLTSTLQRLRTASR